MSDAPEVRTQHCQCGNDTYLVKWTEDGDQRWAECADCGRPTKSLGDGLEKQREMGFAGR